MRSYSIAADSAGREFSAGATLPAPTLRFLNVLPLLSLVSYGILIAMPETRPLAIGLVQENRPVELLTVALLLAAGVLGIRLAGRLKELGQPREARIFFLTFAIGLLVIMMEEIAWGQWFFGFSTPSALEEVNRQGEVTLHNVGALQGRTEYFRLVFGVAGLVGILLSRVPRWRSIAVPPAIWPWFAVITAASLLDLHADFAAVSVEYDRGWRWTSEVVEAVIGGAALLYLWLKWKALPQPAASRAAG